jgi:hypothetical protein
MTLCAGIACEWSENLIALELNFYFLIRISPIITTIIIIFLNEIYEYYLKNQLSFSVKIFTCLVLLMQYCF